MTIKQAAALLNNKTTEIEFSVSSYVSYEHTECFLKIATTRCCDVRIRKYDLLYDCLEISDCNTFQRDHFAPLLLSPNLRKIKIANCTALCDDVLQIAFRHHRFRFLKELRLKRCEGVSKDVFSSIFLSESNALNYIVIEDSPSLGTLENQREWLSIAAAHNWQLLIFIF